MSNMEPGSILWTIVALAFVMVGVIAGKTFVAMIKERWPGKKKK